MTDGACAPDATRTLFLPPPSHPPPYSALKPFCPQGSGSASFAVTPPSRACVEGALSPAVWSPHHRPSSVWVRSVVAAMSTGLSCDPLLRGLTALVAQSGVIATRVFPFALALVLLPSGGARGRERVDRGEEEEKGHEGAGTHAAHTDGEEEVARRIKEVVIAMAEEEDEQADENDAGAALRASGVGHGRSGDAHDMDMGRLDLACVGNPCTCKAAHRGACAEVGVGLVPQQCLRRHITTALTRRVSTILKDIARTGPRSSSQRLPTSTGSDDVSSCNGTTTDLSFVGTCILDALEFLRQVCGCVGCVGVWVWVIPTCCDAALHVLVRTLTPRCDRSPHRCESPCLCPR